MRIRHFSLMIPVLAAASLLAQGHVAAPQRIAAANSTKISSIRVDGSKRYASSELVVASGVKIGAEGTADALTAAADQLAATGMFTDVTYSYVSTPQGTNVKFQVQDVDVLYPALFDNFVWAPREELLRALQQRRPLFRGELPGSGDMYTLLAGDVKAILAEKQIVATVSAYPLVPQLGGDITGFIYKVEGVRTPIKTMEFPGADAEMMQVLRQTSAVKLNTDYTESGMQAFARLDLLPQYLTRGYLHARIRPHEFALIDAASNSVAVRLPVEEGLCYQLAEVQWSGNTAFSAQELAKALKVKVGAPANQPELEREVGGLSNLYGTKGYVEARLKPVPSFDDNARTVSFRVEVKEGDQYRFGSVRLEGSPEALNKKFAELWKLRAGDIYDSSHLGLVVQRLSRTFDFSKIRLNTSQSLNKQTKTVDVVLRFAAK